MNAGGVAQRRKEREMNKELNCTNCSIGDFKHELCDCYNGFCKEFKSIGTQEDFFNAVMQRIRPQGKWENYKDEHRCSECGEVVIGDWYDFEWYDYCPHCGADMR